MIRLLHSGVRAVAASLALVAVVCLGVQGALAGAPGNIHHIHHHHHASHQHAALGHQPHAGQAAAHGYAKALPVAAVADLAGKPDQSPAADPDDCCVACAAMTLAAVDSLPCHASVGRLAAAGRSDPVTGFEPDGLRRPPRSPSLA
jgi:hypothetical protein